MRAALDELARAGRPSSPVSLPHTHYAIATYYLICTAEASSNLARYDGVRFGHRAAEAKIARGALHAHPRRRLRRRAQAPDHARHLRAPRRATTRPTTARRCGRGRKLADDFTAAFASVRRHRHADLARRRRSSSASGGRPAADVPGRRAHGGAEPGRHPGAVAAVRLHQGRPAGRPADHRPAAGRGDLLPRRRRLRGAHRLAHAPAARRCRRERVRWRPTTRWSSGSSATSSWRRTPRSSPGRRRRSAPSPTRATDPVCLGMPGTLPVLNRAAVEAAVRLGLASGCTHPPALPVRAQALLLSRPAQGLSDLAVRRADLRGGRRPVPPARRGALGAPRPASTWRRTRARTCTPAAGVSFVDYNRAGVPLCEIVSEPDVRSAEEAAEYLRAIRTLVRYLGIGDGNMEEGSLRCDANVSLRLARRDQATAPRPRSRT